MPFSAAAATLSLSACFATSSTSVPSFLHVCYSVSFTGETYRVVELALLPPLPQPAAASWMRGCHTVEPPDDAHLAYACRLSLSGRDPVVVRDSTWAVVYALFSAVAAALLAASKETRTPRENARFVMLAVHRSTVMARCSGVSSHSAAAMFALICWFNLVSFQRTCTQRPAPSMSGDTPG